MEYHAVNTMFLFESLIEIHLKLEVVYKETARSFLKLWMMINVADGKTAKRLCKYRETIDVYSYTKSPNRYLRRKGT